MRKTSNQRGDILPAILIISTAFIMVIYGLLFILTLQFDFAERQTAGELAIDIAEAGVNYYRWHLAHDPEDFADGTGIEGQTYEHDYLDPQGASVGNFSLEIISPSQGSSIVTIRSTGSSNNYPNVTRTIEAKYGRRSFAEFSFISNASTWYGTNITVNGKVHSNNGVRMDGRNTSLVTSSQETYTCGSETGCYGQSSCNSPCSWSSSTATCSCPGVWGGGPDSGLWQYPATQFYFENVSFDFGQMQDDADTDGLWLPPSDYAGYHLLFLSNGTVRVYEVTSTNYYYGYDSSDGCQRRYQRIVNESLIGTYNVSDVPIIFAEDYLWVEGTVRGRVTVVAAGFPVETSVVDIWIPNNILYTTNNGSDVLGLIAQRDIYFARTVPESFQINAVLFAQGGHVIRHSYSSSCGGSSTHNVKDALTIVGSVISSTKPYWNWGSGPTSGFITRTVTYDPNVLYNPPPYFPTSGEYEFISWSEE